MMKNKTRITKEAEGKVGEGCCVECHKHNKNAVEAHSFPFWNYSRKSSQHTRCVLKQNKEFFFPCFSAKHKRTLFMLCYIDYIEYIMN